MVSTLRRWLAAIPPLAVLAGAWVWLLIYAFPGIMTQDSYDHLREARDGIYSDGHPPAINLLWKLCDAIVPGPVGMIVIQTTCILAGLYLVLRHLFAARVAAWAAAAVFLFPPIFVPFAVVWKDPLMAGFLLLGCAALLTARRRWQLVGLALMFAATAVRYNAVTATLPLIGLLFVWRPGMRAVARYAIALVAWVAVTLGASRFNAALADHELHLWTSIAVFDIVGTLAHVDEDVPDERLREMFAGSDMLTPAAIHATARELYTPRDFLPITNHPTKTMWALPINGYVAPPLAQREAIGRAWKQVVTTWPWAYAQHRLAVFAEVIGLGTSRASGAIPRREYKWIELPQRLGLATTASPLQQSLQRGFAWVVRHTPLFSVWMYLVIALVLLPLVRTRSELALLLSGLAFEAPLLVAAPSPDFRYSHWTLMCVVLAAIHVVVRRSRARL